MNKFVTFIFISLLFISSIFLPKLSLIGKTCENKTEISVLAEKLGGINANCYYSKQVDNIIGETIEFENKNVSMAKILDLIGARVESVFCLSSCLIINAISKLVPYKNVDSTYNVQIKMSSDKIIIATPKFIN